MQEPDSEARQAIRFLFGPDSIFPLYANLIGSSAESIRSALLNKHDVVALDVNRGFREVDRRILNGRVRLALHAERDMCGITRAV